MVMEMVFLACGRVLGELLWGELEMGFPMTAGKENYNFLAVCFSSSGAPPTKPPLFALH